MKWRRWWYLINAKRRMWWWLVKDEILCKLELVSGYLPELCGRCRRWSLRRDCCQVKHTSGVWVSVCEHCYRELYGDE